MADYQDIEGFTPGPWEVIIDDDGNPLSGRPSVSASDELDCGIVHWDGFVQEYWRSARGDKEIHANARLIAAAPEMHADNARLRAENERLREALAQYQEKEPYTAEEVEIFQRAFDLKIVSEEMLLLPRDLRLAAARAVLDGAA